MSHIVASGFALPIEGLEFDSTKPHRACLLCGAVYQPELARQLPGNYQVPILLQRWANMHKNKHPTREHLALRASGRSMTPEAAHKLAAYGIIPVSDMVLDAETEAALRESSPMPTEDAEC